MPLHLQLDSVLAPTSNLIEPWIAESTSIEPNFLLVQPITEIPENLKAHLRPKP